MKKTIIQLTILLALVVVLSVFYAYNKAQPSQSMNTSSDIVTTSLGESFTLHEHDSVRVGDLVVTYVSTMWPAAEDLGPRHEIQVKKDGENEQERIFLDSKDSQQSYKEFTITLEYSSDAPIGIPAGVTKKESAYIGLRVTNSPANAKSDDNWYTFVNSSVGALGDMNYRIILSNRRVFQTIEIRNSIDLTQPGMVEILHQGGYASVLRVAHELKSDGSIVYKYWIVTPLNKNEGKFVFTDTVPVTDEANLVK